jgi:hypothetical protein
MFVYRVLRGIFGPMLGEVSITRIKLNCQKLNNFYSTFSIIRSSKIKRQKKRGL